MKSESNHFWRAGGGIEEHKACEYRESQGVVPSNCDMTAYRCFCGHSSESLFSLYGQDFGNAFTQQHDFDTDDCCGDSLITHQEARFGYQHIPNISSSFSSLPYLQQGRSSIHSAQVPYHADAQISREELYPAAMQQSPQVPFLGTWSSSPSPKLTPHDLIAPQRPFIGDNDQYYSAPLWQHNLPNFRLSISEQSTTSNDDLFSSFNNEEEEDETYDKPYAQLIYDALKQAPGHRMLLRDIYEWFVCNTRKPRDSGTNGWQNSIRHNLSMNQAFENDKSDPSAGKGARKANSIWVLTDHAFRHGVQSTTRFRRSTGLKKAGTKKIPAIQRQRSGAKGGRAARRTARLKLHEDRQRQVRNIRKDLHNSPPRVYSPDLLPNAQDELSIYSYSPPTPIEEQVLGVPYCLPDQSYYEHSQQREPVEKNESYLEEQEEQMEHLQHIFSTSYSTLGKNGRL